MLDISQQFIDPSSRGSAAADSKSTTVRFCARCEGNSAVIDTLVVHWAIRRRHRCHCCRATWFTWEAREDSPLLARGLLCELMESCREQRSKQRRRPRKITQCSHCKGKLPERWTHGTPKRFCSVDCRDEGTRARYRNYRHEHLSKLYVAGAPR